MNFNFVKLKKKEIEQLDSFLVYVKLIGYEADYLCLFENNLKEKLDCIFIANENKQIIVIFSVDGKIKIQHENKNSERVEFSRKEINNVFEYLYKEIN